MNRSRPKYLFDCLPEVRRQLHDQARVAIFLDLDGTLASITRTPKMTRLKPQTRTALRALINDKRYRIAIVSGRAMDDLKGVVKLPEITYVGNHGLEIDGSGLRYLHAEANDRVALMAEVCGRLKSRLRVVQGVIVEFKTLTLTVHHRLAAARDIDQIRTVVDDCVASFADHVRVTEGKRVLELRPNVAWNKGSAVNWILSQIGLGGDAAIYVGDDKTDEDAFASLPSSITINVGTKFDTTSARYFVRSPEGVLAFIHRLAVTEEHLMNKRAAPMALRASSAD